MWYWIREALKIIGVFMVWGAAFFLMSRCDSQSEADCKKQNARYDNIQAVYKHEVGQFSIEYEVAPGKPLAQVYVGAGQRVLDVPADKPMWAEKVATYKDNWCETMTTIHVHGAADVIGAGWNHGKGGHGQTVVTDTE